MTNLATVAPRFDSKLTRTLRGLGVCLVILAACTSEPERPPREQGGFDHVAAGDVESGRNLATPPDLHHAAAVRFINALPGNDAMVALLAERQQTAPIPAGGHDAYRPVAPGIVSLVVRASRPADGVWGHRSSALRDHLLADGRYTAIAMPRADGQDLVLRVFDDRWLENGDAAQVRLINAVTPAGSFDLVLVGTHHDVFTNVTYANATPFQRLAPSAAQQFALRSSDRPLELNTVPGLSRLDAGRAYTIVVMGRRDAWRAIVLDDDVAAAATPTKDARTRETRSRQRSARTTHIPAERVGQHVHTSLPH